MHLFEHYQREYGIILRGLYVGLLLSLLFVRGTIPSAEAADGKLLNVGWTSGASWAVLPLRIANERGFFENEGLKVRFITFQGTNLLLTALLAGEIDYVTILPFIAGAAARGVPVKIVAAVGKSSGYAIISKPEIQNLKALKGKRVAINSFGSSPDYAVYTALRRSGLDPNRDVTLLAISGSTDARFAALISGAVDATLVSSPFEYRAEQRGFKTLVSVREMAEFVKIPLSGISVAQKKIEKEPQEIVRFLKALRSAILFLQSQREIGIQMMEQVLKLDRSAAERFYAQYREQYNSDLSVPDSVAEEWIAMGTFRDKEKPRGLLKPQVVYDWTLAERAKQ